MPDVTRPQCIDDFNFVTCDRAVTFAGPPVDAIAAISHTNKGTSLVEHVLQSFLEIICPLIVPQTLRGERQMAGQRDCIHCVGNRRFRVNDTRNT